MKHQHRDLRKTIAIAAIAAMIMFSFTFTMAPLYNTLCKTTGYNGTLNLAPFTKKQSNLPPDKSRQITMQLVSTNNANLPWDFYAKTNIIKVHPEENTKIIFFAKNNSQKTITVQAVPSITPWQAAKYLHKIECFCFTQQTLKAGESLDMPVVFRIDKALPKDIKTVTLSYTLFEIAKPKNLRKSE